MPSDHAPVIIDLDGPLSQTQIFNRSIPCSILVAVLETAVALDGRLSQKEISEMFPKWSSGLEGPCHWEFRGSFRPL
jgi:hypothetical protein